VNLVGAEQIGGLVEPLFDPDDPYHYVSIHSNPPGILTSFAGLTVHTYGKGRAVYLAAPLLKQQMDAQQSFGAWLLQEYTPPALVRATNAPVCVEITVLRGMDTGATLVAMVNYQKELPNVPVLGVKVKLEWTDQEPKRCVAVSTGAALAFTCAQGALSFEVPLLETIEMVEIF
jgi:hypothetical protein